jgi:hypothetical protein
MNLLLELIFRRGTIMDTQDEAKSLFLKKEFFNMAWNASVQRNLTYVKNASETERKKFKDSIHKFLKKLEPLDEKPIAESQHIENIKKLIQYAEEIGGQILYNGEFKVANAQKLINVYYKYLWCAGLCGMPVHCPVDRTVLEIAGIHDKNWTDMRALQEYLEIIAKLKEIIGKGKPLAVWELKNYS